jgi:hypothetical protein
MEQMFEFHPCSAILNLLLVRIGDYFMSIGNPDASFVRLDILVDAHDKLLKKYAELVTIADTQALSFISLKKSVEDPNSEQAKRGCPHYLQLVYGNLNRYIHFKAKYNPKPKNEIKSETA